MSAKERAKLEDKLGTQEQQCKLYEECLVIPVNRLPLRGARYDVCLREEPLRAVHAMHTILSRMVMFNCKWCRERFPTFHPAYAPPRWLEKKMEILKKGRDGVAACDVSVASWDEVPLLPAAGSEEDAIASVHSGVCLKCHKDIVKQYRISCHLVSKCTPPGGECGLRQLIIRTL